MRPLSSKGAPIELVTAGGGGETLAFLKREPAYTDALRPDLILLDLNMPRMNAHEMLVEMKRDERLMAIPTIILSTSSDEADVYQAYREHASAYLTKPPHLKEKAERMRSFLDFRLGAWRSFRPRRRARAWNPTPGHKGLNCGRSNDAAPGARRILGCF